jgi:D-sedoheptulose 7-phosphate isomerase
MRDIVQQILEESIRLRRRAIESQLERILRGAEILATCLRSGHKVLIFGNGGSAADAQHLAAEFVNRFRIERSPLAAIALTTDSSILTSIGNDYDFTDVFSKQIVALGKPEDVAWGFSTSGNSANVTQAIKIAKQNRIMTIGMTGRGGELADCADLVFSVDSTDTARIQEVHITIGHILCELLDRMLYPQKFN